MKVRDVMETGVIAVRPHATYREAVQLMHAHRISGLPVVDDSESIVGMISEKDLFRAMFPRYEEYLAAQADFADQEALETNIAKLATHPVVEYMTRRVLTIPSDAPILRAGGVMLAHGVHRLPVVDGRRLVGIVSREDIYRTIFRQHFGLEA